MQHCLGADALGRPIHQAPLDSLAEAAHSVDMSRARPLQPPIMALLDDPLVRSLPSAPLGMLIRLCEHFWRTECRPFPRDDDTIMGLARVHRPTYRANREAILEAFGRWEPIAMSALERYRLDLEKLSIAGKLSRSGMRARANGKYHTPPETLSTPRLLNPIGRPQPTPGPAKYFTD